MAAVPRPVLSPRQWAEVRALYEKCGPLNTAERRQLLDSETRGRAWLRDEVESLLAQDARADGSFLDAPFSPQFPTARTEDVFRPQRLGKYLLLQRIGRGGMAEVFLAKAQGPNNFERPVALKRILPELAADAQLRNLFEVEARLTSHLTHPNIVHLYDFGTSEGSYFLAMELVNGVNLATVIDRGVLLPPEVALYIAAGVAEGLDYAHRRTDELTGKPLEIIHRDISPKNIMISFSGDVKIVDFGIAKIEGRVAATRTGSVRGTMGYLSPETVAGKKVDCTTDIFSLSAVLYELLAGRPLFDGENLFSTMAQIRGGQVAYERVESLSIAPEMKALLHRGLNVVPENRFPSAQDFRAAVAECNEPFRGTDPRARLGEVLQQVFPDRRLRDQSLRLEVPVARTPALRRTAELVTSRGLPPRPPPKKRISAPKAIAVFAMGAAAVLYLTKPLPRPTAAPIVVSQPAAAEPVVQGPPPKVVEAPPPPKATPVVQTPSPVVPPPPSVVAPVAAEPPPEMVEAAQTTRETAEEIVAPAPRAKPTGTIGFPQACGDDALKLCPGKQVGAGLVACLSQRKASLSDPCREMIEHAPRPGGPPTKRP